jgi:tetratricopeptide (TPR) repeat protein
MATLDELFEEAEGHVALGELEEASASYRKATELDPQSFDAWHALGMVLMKLQRYPEAIEAGQRAVALKPNEQMGYTSLSLAYVRNGQIKEAEEMGAKARIISWGGKVVKDAS